MSIDDRSDNLKTREQSAEEGESVSEPIVDLPAVECNPLWRVFESERSSVTLRKALIQMGRRNR